MADIGLEWAIALFIVALLAGTIDAIAGGGGLLTVPALLGSGLPPLAALGTNKLQSSFGSFAALLRYRRAGWITLGDIAGRMGVVLLGAVMGVAALQQFDNALLRDIIPYALLAAALYFALSPNLQQQTPRGRLSPLLYSLMIAPLIGFYDGFFGPGTGSFFVLSLVLFGGKNLQQATAETKALNFTSNIAALGYFILMGQVVWLIGLVMAVGQYLGGTYGAVLVLRYGTRLVRPLLIIMAVAMAVKLIIFNDSLTSIK